MLWDFEDAKAVAEIKDKITSRGVRGMTYEYEYGGYLISYGFDNYLNVWCPEVSLTRSSVGKLEGHSAIIVSAKFIQSSPNICLLYTSPSPRDRQKSRMPSSA
eukprot:TRINITY_DN11240_c0_g1_i1.p4 TRINITY_DN11240_c0_g1~~TRINITY_DN11240_c0_g1_i1.p4  ORF type:complete len:103 (-),score=22.19 TRINITY_DN11240_c0_g1_i1:49-357(-)